MTGTETPKSRLTPAMSRVVFGVAAVIVIVAVVTIWLLVSSDSARQSSSTQSSADASDSSLPDPSPSTSQTVGPLPDATPTSGSEVLAPTAAPDEALPPIVAPKALVPTPFPSSAAADGEIVDGFPANVMGAIPESDVLQSSVATQGEVMQVSLVGRTNSSPEEVRAHYAALWLSLGLQDQGPASDGAGSYAGAYENLTVAASASGTGTRYTLFGVFRAG